MSHLILTADQRQVLATLGPLDARLDAVGPPGEPGPLQVQVGQRELLVDVEGQPITEDEVAA